MIHIRAGSQDTFMGVCYDVAGKVRTPINLTDATLTLRASLNGVVTTLPATPDFNQTANPGLYSYDIQPTDFPTPGRVQMTAVIMKSGRMFKSKMVYVKVDAVV